MRVAQSLAAFLVLTAASTAQTRWLVPQQLPDLASAVAVAQDGDVIQMAAGVHFVGGVRIDKSLDVVGDANTALYGGPSSAPLTLAIPAGKQLTLRTLSCTAPFFVGFDLEIGPSPGRVTLLDCSVRGTVRVAGSAQVLFVRCALTGGQLGPNVYGPAFPALTVGGSTVLLQQCTLFGARANYETSTLASMAADLAAADVRCVDTVLHGGDANRSFFPELPGTNAASATNSSLRFTGASAVTAGSFFSGPALVIDNGQLVLEPQMNPSVTLAGGATLVQQTRPTVVAANVAAGMTATLTLRSPNGTFGALMVGFPADRIAFAGIVSDLWLDPATMCIAALGVQNGALGWSAPVPTTWAWPVQFRWQGIVLDSGTLTLSDPGAEVLQ